MPTTSEAARRLGMMTLDQMVRAMIVAVEHPSTGIRILEVPDIKLSLLDSNT